MTFDFTVPVTWSDIINVISTFVAFIAVIVAIVANCKASKSLKYSLKMQEQSKNIDLFEKRVSIIEEIKQKDKTSKLELELLFNDCIVKEYKIMLECFNDYLNVSYDIDVYRKIIMDTDGVGGYISPIEELLEVEQTLEKLNYPDDKVKDFENLCDKYQIVYSESGDEKDLKKYNYKELSEKKALSNIRFEKQKKLLLDSMQSFVKNSISPLDKKGKNSR